METTQIEVEDAEIFNRPLRQVKQLLSEAFAHDREDFIEDLEELLDAKVASKVSVEIVLHIGKRAITVDGFTAEEKEEKEEDSDSLFSF